MLQGCWLGWKAALTFGSAMAQHFVSPSGSHQQDQNQEQDWILGTGLEGDTGSVTVQRWADPFSFPSYSSGPLEHYEEEEVLTSDP